MKLRIAADILDRHWNLKKILNLANPRSSSSHGFEGVWHRQQVMGITAIHATPAEMVRKPRGLRSARQCLQPFQVLTVQWLRRAKVHRHTMLNHLIAVQYLVERSQRGAAIHHVVLRDDLKPVDRRFLRKDMIVV